MVMVAVCGEVSEGQNATGSLGPPSFPLPPSLPLLSLLASPHHRHKTPQEDPPPINSALLQSDSSISSFLPILAAAVLANIISGYREK